MDGWLSSRSICKAFSVILLASLMLTGLNTNTASAASVDGAFAYDFGTDSSPLATGYTRVTEATVYGGAYGWTTTSGLESRDRPAEANDLKRDFVMSSSVAKTFKVALASGSYLVTVTMGDHDYAHDNMVVSAYGTPKLSDVDTPAGSFVSNAFSVTVTGGVLELGFSDAGGGTDPTWVVNAVTISPNQFDFGTGSHVAVGYTSVTDTTAFSSGGYGWADVSGLASVDRLVPADDLKRDFVYSSTPHTFKVALPAGSYLVTVMMGDQNYAHDNMVVTAYGTPKLSDVDTPAGSFVSNTFSVTVVGGVLELGFSDNGGLDLSWVVNALTIAPTGTPPGAFNKINPANGATGRPTDLTLSWGVSSGATSYEYCYDKTNDGLCSPWVSAGTTTNASIMDLAADSTYYWQVHAKNTGHSTDAAGGWWSFTTQPYIPPAPLHLTSGSVGTQDGFVRETTETSGRGGTINSTGLTVAVGDDALNRQYRAILSFNTATLPDTAVITGVTLMIRKQGLVGTNPFTTHGNIVVDIRKGAFGTTRALESADFQATANMNAAGTIVRTPWAGNWYYANLRSAAYSFINTVGITQVRLRFTTDDNNDFGADYLTFYSGNYDPVSSRPRLVIVYHRP